MWLKFKNKLPQSAVWWLYD